MIKLNPHIFDTDVEQLPIREGFGQGLVLAAERDTRVVGLCADLTESTKMLQFKKKFPERFIEIGVAEQNLASVASGMAAMGKIPFMTSYAMFSPGRNWEQIRTTICYNDRKVIIAGSHAGVSVGPDGGTHQAIEDIAITRVIPNLTVIVPCDAIEAKKATLASALDATFDTDGTLGAVKTPVYIRLAREKSPIITTEETPFRIGKAQIFFEVDDKKVHDVGIIACGQLVFQALKIAREYKEKGIAVKVMNLATIKPLDQEAVLSLAKETKCIVTVEEHQVHGGMGSAVAEYLVENFPVPMEFVGVQDLFGQSGTPAELLVHYGMGEEHIRTAVQNVLVI
jgi:transketolase